MIEVSLDSNVRFTFDYPTRDQVYLVGDFNDWNEKSHPMILLQRKWVLDIPLPPGEYAFNYRVGNLFYNDRFAHKYVHNCWGAEISVVIVPLNKTNNTYAELQSPANE